MPPYAPTAFAEQKMLQQRLTAARAESAVPLGRDEVAGIVQTVLSSLAGDATAHDLQLYRELEGLAQYIQEAKKELASLRPADIRDQHIPTATDELDAVVGATEQATFAIFDACDVVGAVAGRIDGENAAQLTDATTRIFEACNFQDITGQRITKVVRALKHIEAKVDALIAFFGEEMTHVTPPPADEAPADNRDPDKDLLHGPQMPGNAIDQDEIDRLLASFD